MTIEAGTVLAGRYRVVRHVGTGGMASVYLATDEVLRREVAVKRVHAAPASESGRRIMREARIGGRLRHPGLVTVFDIVEDVDALLLVMEFVPGETLAQRLRRGSLPVAEALAVLRAVAEALDHAHAEGVVHRDVKPANILLRDGGGVKLADLGVATADDVTQITRTGGLLGTVSYMAPEQFEPGPVTAAADVYALASVAFECLAGRRPFDAPTPLELMGRIREIPAPDLRAMRADTPAAAADALRRGMAKDPADRPATAGALVGDLAAAFAADPAPFVDPPTVEQPAVTATPPPPTADPAPPPAAAPNPSPPRAAPRRLAWLVVVAVIAVAVAGVVLLSGDDTERGASSSPSGTQTGSRTEAAAEPKADGSSPEAAVRGFYTRAADGDLDGAWNLAGPAMRAQFENSRAAFEDTLGSLRSIEFVRLEETQRSAAAATVAIQTVAQHTNRTDRCTGTLRTIRRGEGWRVEPAGVSCR